MCAFVSPQSVCGWRLRASLPKTQPSAGSHLPADECGVPHALPLRSHALVAALWHGLRKQMLRRDRKWPTSEGADGKEAVRVRDEEQWGGHCSAGNSKESVCVCVCV